MSIIIQQESLADQIDSIKFDELPLIQVASIVREVLRFQKRDLVLAKLHPEWITAENIDNFLDEDSKVEHYSLFSALDVDKSSSISFKELYTGFEEMGLQVDQFGKMLERFQGKEIDYKEFSAIIFMADISIAKGRSNSLSRSLTVPIKRLSLTTRVWTFLEYPRSSKSARCFSALIISLTIISSGAFVIETLPYFQSNENAVFAIVEGCCIFFFTLELIFRLSSCPSYFCYFTSILNWIDILVVVPFYVERIQGPSGGSSLRAARLFRILRLLKVGRYIRWIKIFGATFYESRVPLAIFQLLLFILLVSTSSVMFYIERGEWNGYQFHVPGNTSRSFGFETIPASIWFSMATLTTVGFGDVYALTFVGKCLAVGIAISGIILLAIPVAVLASEFKSQYNNLNSTKKLKVKLRKPKMSDEEITHEITRNPVLRKFEIATQEERIFALSTYHSIRKAQRDLLNNSKRKEHDNRYELIKQFKKLQRSWQ